MTAFKVGDRVRFKVEAFASEIVGLGDIAVGEEGVIININPVAIWPISVEVQGKYTAWDDKAWHMGKHEIELVA